MTNASENPIEGTALSKVFRDFWGRPKVQAVTEVDIQVRPGTVLGMLGPNGAGKSTVMKLILGHLYPTSGRLAVFGKHPRDVEIKSRLGYLPERAYLYKHLTPLETLRFFGEILELPRDVIRSRSEQLIEMVGLGRARKRMVGEFSHGMGRRMGLAQALLNDPDLLLLDEPTAGLDPLGCRDVKDLILTMAGRGKTVVLTSHLLADVEDVCDELLILYGGRVQACGPARELLARRDRLQITMPAPDAAALSRLKTTLPQAMGTADIEYGMPTRNLENYFLDVVRNASQVHETQGALVGSGVADYLRPATETAPPAAEPDRPLDNQPSRTVADAPPPASAPQKAAMEAVPESSTKPVEPPAPVASDRPATDASESSSPASAGPVTSTRPAAAAPTQTSTTAGPAQAWPRPQEKDEAKVPTHADTEDEDDQVEDIDQGMLDKLTKS